MYISQLVCYLDAGLGKAIPDFDVVTRPHSTSIGSLNAILA
jgi:hypothetical protein